MERLTRLNVTALVVLTLCLMQTQVNCDWELVTEGYESSGIVVGQRPFGSMEELYPQFPDYI